MPLKSYKICSKIFEHGFDPPPFWTMFKKTMDLEMEGTPNDSAFHVFILIHQVRQRWPSCSLSCGQQQDQKRGQLILHEVSDCSCLQPHGPPLPYRGGPVVWPQRAAGPWWNPPSRTCRSWKIIPNSLQSHFINIDLNTVDFEFSIPNPSCHLPCLVMHRW